MMSKNEFQPQDEIDSELTQTPKTIASQAAMDDEDFEYQLGVDNRNLKFKAKNGGGRMKDIKRSYNFKEQQKYFKRQTEKAQRENEAYTKKVEQQLWERENKKWAPVDAEDAKHMKKQAQKMQMKQQKQEAKLNKKQREAEDEEMALQIEAKRMTYRK